jgi:hypothetical protein
MYWKTPSFFWEGGGQLTLAVVRFLEKIKGEQETRKMPRKKEDGEKRKGINVKYILKGVEIKAKKEHQG